MGFSQDIVSRRTTIRISTGCPFIPARWCYYLTGPKATSVLIKLLAVMGIEQPIAIASGLAGGVFTIYYDVVLSNDQIRSSWWSRTFAGSVVGTAFAWVVFSSVYTGVKLWSRSG